jgi:Kdo2-lipid IVA lauroyltransferase/acyltransferase
MNHTVEERGAHRDACGADAAAPDPRPAGARWLRALGRLPWPLLYALCALLAWLLHYGLRYRVGVARANLRRCFPERSAGEIGALLNAHYRRLGELVAEFCKLSVMPPAQLRARVQLLHVERVQAQAGAGRSVLLLAAHQCNWEWSLQAVALGLGMPLDAAYKPLHSSSADRQLRAVRARFGARLIPAKTLLRELSRRRRAVHALALLADQAPASSEVRHSVHFLATDTAFYGGPAELARLTGYAAFFVAMRRVRRGHYEVEFLPLSSCEERLDAASFTARYAQQVEAQVRAAPADWTWTHRRWKPMR